MIFGLVMLVVTGMGFLIIVKLLPEPTCFDKKKNQDEFGVDCGGPCGPCELKNPKPIITFWARAVPVREQVYDAAALIQNPNEVLSSTNVTYEFLASDELGSIAKRAGTTFLLAQERTTIIEPNIKLARDPTKIEFRITATDWEVRKDAHPNIFAERRDYKTIEENGKKQSVVDAIIFNSTPFHYRAVAVQFIVLDPDGNLVGINKIILEDMRAGSRRPVRSIWPGELPGIPATIQVETRVNIFNADAIIKPE